MPNCLQDFYAINTSMHTPLDVPYDVEACTLDENHFDEWMHGRKGSDDVFDLKKFTNLIKNASIERLLLLYTSTKPTKRLSSLESIFYGGAIFGNVKHI